MKKNKNVFMGVLLLAGAATVLLSGIGFMQHIGIWDVFWTVVFAGFLYDGLAKHSFGGVLFPVAFLAIVHAERFHLEAFTPGPVLIAALLGTVGLNLLFPHMKNGKKQERQLLEDGQHSGTINPGGSQISGMDGQYVMYKSSFGDAVKYITSTDLCEARLSSSFANLDVYMDSAQLMEGKAEVVVDCSFGAINIYIPASWEVFSEVSAAFGSFEEKGRKSEFDGNMLHIMGNVSFGCVTVHYI